MTSKIAVRTASAIVASLGLAGGLAGVAAADNAISGTGTDSSNTINADNNSTWKVRNKNHVWLHNSTHQKAYTGDANVSGNTTGGDATTGSASNSNMFDASVTLDNSATTDSCGCGGGSGGDNSIDTTGTSSSNTVNANDYSSVSIKNYNNVGVSNYTTQKASSGDANVSGNTTGGSATTGDASNTNSSTVSISVTN